MARRKITEPSDLPSADGLPELTAQQMEFVRGILEGKNATEAYRAAYNCKNMAQRTVWAEASRLRNHHDVSAWIYEARVACATASKVTLDGHLSELERLKELAMKAGNYGAAVQAEQLRGKAAGHYVEQVRDLTERDPVELLSDIAKHSPDLAKTLAIQHGLPWTEH